MAPLQNLSQLNVQDNSIVSVEKLLDYPHLTNLDVSNNLIESLDPLLQLNSLNYLFADFNPLNRAYCEELDLLYCEEPANQQLLLVDAINPIKSRPSSFRNHCPDFGPLDEGDHRARKSVACLARF